MSNSSTMRRTALALAAVATVVAGQTAHAATKPLVIADLTGDANGVNSQAFGLPLPATSTAAASVKGADIASVTVANVFKGKGRTAKPAGLTVTLRTVGALQQGVDYSMTMDLDQPCGGSSRVQLGYENVPSLNNGLAICQSAQAGGTSTTIGSTSVDAAKGVITWSLDGSAFGKGVRITDFAASATVFVVGVFDEVRSDKVFTYGR